MFGALLVLHAIALHAMVSGYVTDFSKNNEFRCFGKAAAIAASIGLLSETKLQLAQKRKLSVMLDQFARQASSFRSGKDNAQPAGAV